MSIASDFFAHTLFIVPSTQRFFMRDALTGETKPLQIPYLEFFALHQLVKTVGLEAATRAALYIAQRANDLGLSADETERVRHLLEAVHYYIYVAHGPEREEDVLGMVYSLLSDKAINREEAADLASSLLERPVKADALRKRLDRWAEAKGLPKITLYKRRGGESETVKQ